MFTISNYYGVLLRCVAMTVAIPSVILPSVITASVITLSVIIMNAINAE
jgi:hypothetical protein